MAQTQLAAQMYTLRDYCKNPKQLAETLNKVKAIGYDVVQISGICPIDYAELKKMVDDAGISICATHISFDTMLEDIGKVIADHQTIECKYPAIGGMPGRYRSAEGFAQFARDANEVGKKLAAAGQYFGYHNHSFELEKFGGRTGLQIIYEDSSPDFVKAEIDTYWIQHGGADPAQWIEKLAGRIPLVHLKDMTVCGGQPTMAEVGEGNLNWPRILEACRNSGVEWYIVEQDTCKGSPFDSLKISLENLRAMGIS